MNAIYGGIMKISMKKYKEKIKKVMKRGVYLAINDFSSKVDQEIDRIEDIKKDMQLEIDYLRQQDREHRARAEHIEKRMDKIEDRLNKVDADMLQVEELFSAVEKMFSMGKKR